jgi:AcrR family transcriptional regulator
MKSPAHVETIVGDAKLVEQRRAQILRAAVKLFSEKGYYITTVQQIARKAGVSTGLIYQYFGDKDDILFLALKLVLETYKKEIPRRLEGVDHPVDRLCTALWAYCRIVDRLRDATVLAYRSTKSLRADRRDLIKEEETKTNKLLEACLQSCIAEGYMRPINEYLLAYQYVNFCHAWALKNWAFQGRFSLGQYVTEGIRLLVEPFLNEKGRLALDDLRQRTGDFSEPEKSETRPLSENGVF